MKTLLLSAAFATLAVGAQAATISLMRSGEVIATIDCGDAACEGWTGSGWSEITAEMFTVHPPSDATEEAWVGGIVGEDFSGMSNKLEDPDDDPQPQNSLAEYVLFKLGGGNTLATALLRNVSGGAITYEFTQIGNAAGLSHTNQFGMVSAVPLPASGALFGAVVLAGGVAARRRRRR